MRNHQRIVHSLAHADQGECAARMLARDVSPDQRANTRRVYIQHICEIDDE